MSVALAASATTGGGVLPPPFSIAVFTKHRNRRICQHNSSIAAFPKQNLRISPSKFSISAFPKQNLRISPSKFSISAFPKHNHLGIYPSKFDDCNRGSLFQSRCSSEIAESDTSTKRVSMIDRFKSMMYQRYKQLLGLDGLELPPHPPQYYRIINLEVIMVPENYDKKVRFEEGFITFKNACDACHRFLAEQDIREMLFGDVCRKLVLYMIAQFLQYLLKYYVCSRSTACFSYNNPSEEPPVFLGHPPFFYMEDNSFDMTAAYEFQLQVSVDGEKSDESICTCDNLEHFLQRLSAFGDKYYAVSVNYRRIMLERKISGVGNHSYIIYKKCI